ncbi:hypothetical protein Cni_G06138 [Canna indica]|uniref:RRM domain-containing protein n=1 Tax=Canna indica TaxID=4628 RepID=A0AAQ3K0V8_9LILI|nr:hypothetical protein Cni_G06138 [Canna indica]
MATSSEAAKKAYAEFEEKVKRTVFLDNLSPQVTVPVIKQALGQFGNVVNVEFISNYTIPYPIPQCALVEMGDEKQSQGVVSELTSHPFMMSGIPRPVIAKIAQNEMFADRPVPPDRKIEVRWVEQLEPSDPDFEAIRKLKILCKKQNAQHLALIKHQLTAEENIAKQQEETLKVHFKKYQLIESIMQDGTGARLARRYGLRLDED